jgi:hypothetical protein
MTFDLLGILFFKEEKQQKKTRRSLKRARLAPQLCNNINKIFFYLFSFLLSAAISSIDFGFSVFSLSYLFFDDFDCLSSTEEEEE